MSSQSATIIKKVPLKMGVESGLSFSCIMCAARFTWWSQAVGHRTRSLMLIIVTILDLATKKTERRSSPTPRRLCATTFPGWTPWFWLKLVGQRLLLRSNSRMLPSLAICSMDLIVSIFPEEAATKAKLKHLQLLEKDNKLLRKPVNMRLSWFLLKVAQPTVLA